MESNFRPPLFEFRLCRRSFGVKIQGSKPENLGFDLSQLQYATFAQLHEILHGGYL